MELASQERASPPARPPGGSAPGAGRALALLLAINLFNYIDRYVLSAAIAPIRQEFFAPDDLHTRFWTGTLATAFLVSYMLAAPIFGLLADRISRWKLIGGAVAVWSLASGASGLAPTFLVLLLTRMCVGIGEAAYGPAAPALISDLYPIERRGRVLSWFYMAIPVGSALGYAFGGVMVEHAHWLIADCFVAPPLTAILAFPLSPHAWRVAFYSVVPPGLLLALLCFWMRDPSRGASDLQPVAHRAAHWRDYTTLFRTPSYVLNTLGMTAMTFAVGGVAFWMPDYIHEFRGQPHPARIGLIFGGLTALAGLAGTLLGGLAGDKLTKRYPGAYFLVSGGSMLVAFPCFLLVLYRPFPEAWGWMFLTEFCLFFNTGPANAILANVTHSAVRASGYALNILIIHLLGDAISPPLIGRLAGLSEGNMNVGFQAVSAAIVVSGIFWLWGARYLGEDTRLAPLRIGSHQENDER